LALGHKQATIAEKFNVNRNVVTRINTGTRWGHVKLKEEV